MVHYSLFGDSIAVGIKPYLKHEPEVFDAQVGRHLGEGVDRVIKSNPFGKLTVVSLGTNDVGYQLDYFQIKIEKVIEAVAHGYIIWGTTVNNLRFNKVLRSYHSERFKTIGYYIPGPDGVHPRNYEALADRYWHKIMKGKEYLESQT